MVRTPEETRILSLVITQEATTPTHTRTHSIPTTRHPTLPPITRVVMAGFDTRRDQVMEAEGLIQLWQPTRDQVTSEYIYLIR